MSSLTDLNNAINRIDINDYNKAKQKLGRIPVSTIEYQSNYKPKEEKLNKQIVKAKNEVDGVAASILNLDRKLSNAQSIINPTISKLESGLETDSYAYEEVINQMRKVQKQLSVIRANIAVMQEKLGKLGNKI